MLQPDQFMSLVIVLVMVAALVTLSHVIDESEFEDFQEDKDKE